MSFIQQTYRCKKCNKEINVALGTYGFGFPKQCERCTANDFELIADSVWIADESK